MIKLIVKRQFGSSATRAISRDPVFEKMGIKPKVILRNLSAPELYESTIKKIYPANPETKLSVVSSSGALCAYSGQRTGRSPSDKRIVLDETTEKEIWWGDVNFPINPSSYNALEEVAIQYLNNRPRLYVMDGYIGWDPKYRIKCRVLCARSYHALFMKNMMIKPTEEELQTDFANGADYYIFNAGEFPAPSSGILPGVGKNSTCVSVNLSEKRMVILGSQYAGEMKKGLFGVMHYLMPKLGVLSMHCSANEGNDGDTTLLFGLSGTGKTTLSTDPQRKLIGDDEHCWTPDGVFNIEGGCYAKTVGLSQEKEPEIYNAIRFGSVLENVQFYDEHSRDVNYHDVSITENTRVAYPLEYIPQAKIPAIGGHPKNIIFLTCDAFGVIPPVSKLTQEQAQYHFIAGYTAKVAGTEMGIKEPQPTFSACFGEAFLPLHPIVYAKMLADKMTKHRANCWLINTGWSGGKYGTGQRMDLKITRKIIDEIHNGNLENTETTSTEIFGFNIPKKVNGVDSELLQPRNTWQNKNEFDEQLNSLAKFFQKNFKKYEDQIPDPVKNAGPKL